MIHSIMRIVVLCSEVWYAIKVRICSISSVIFISLDLEKAEVALKDLLIMRKQKHWRWPEKYCDQNFGKERADIYCRLFYFCLQFKMCLLEYFCGKNFHVIVLLFYSGILLICF